MKEKKITDRRKKITFRKNLTEFQKKNLNKFQALQDN